MKKIFFCTLLISNLLFVKSQSFYQDKNISMEASFNTIDSTILLKITNNNKKIMYLYARVKRYGINYPHPYYTYGSYLKGDPILPLKPWRHEKMYFKRLPQGTSENLIIPKGQFDTISSPIELKNFKIIITIEYLLLPQRIYIPDNKFRNDEFLKYIKRRGYIIQTIETPPLILDYNVNSKMKPIIMPKQ